MSNNILIEKEISMELFFNKFISDIKRVNVYILVGSIIISIILLAQLLITNNKLLNDFHFLTLFIALLIFMYLFIFIVLTIYFFIIRLAEINQYFAIIIFVLSIILVINVAFPVMIKLLSFGYSTSLGISMSNYIQTIFAFFSLLIAILAPLYIYTKNSKLTRNLTEQERIYSAMPVIDKWITVGKIDDLNKLKIKLKINNIFNNIVRDIKVSSVEMKVKKTDDNYLNVQHDKYDESDRRIFYKEKEGYQIQWEFNLEDSEQKDIKILIFKFKIQYKDIYRNTYEEEHTFNYKLNNSKLVQSMMANTYPQIIRHGNDLTKNLYN